MLAITKEFSEKISRLTPITRGVSQKSVLSSLLLIISTSDIKNRIVFRVSKFDDNKKLCFDIVLESTSV